jgi:FKBP-type peptidyl-prolyl cis-trans isomerase FkpA
MNFKTKRSVLMSTVENKLKLRINFINFFFLLLTSYLLLLTSYLLLLTSCTNREQPKPLAIPDIEKVKKPLEIANKHMIKTEDEQITEFISRYQWNMTKTASGLRYLIYKKGNGLKPESGSKVKIDYEVKLINGTLIYSSRESGPKEFIIGKSNAEPGLEEGLLLMRVGDKSKLIIPSYLAYGLHGDENKIPKRATLVYDVELLDASN